MVCTANELLEWKDFPKGLRVLLLDEDSNSASEIKSKLEQMEYIVFAFFSQHEAVSAISSKSEIFHVAIAEVNSLNNDERYKFLESAKDLPTIMTSDEHCLSTMMKCIALGAVEFLVKPLSEDKLRNIWQHVVHKAFNAGGNESSESVKEFVGSVLDIQKQNLVSQNQVPKEVKEESEMSQNEHDHESNINDKFPAPSTPQLKQGGRIFDDGDCQDHINSSPDKDSQDQTHDGSPVHGYQNLTHDGSPVKDFEDQTSGSPINGGGGFDIEAKSVDITRSDSVTKMEIDPPEVVIKDEGGCEDGSERMHECDSSSKLQNGDKMDATDSPGTMDKSDKLSTTQNVNGAKSSRKKVKVDWTPELHKKFVQAVEKLGVDQAIPSRILELMKVEGLTRHNVASHLQKYRMHRRHILPKDNSRRWPHPRDTLQRSYYPPRPVMAFPPYHTNHNLPPGQVYPIWGPGPQGGQPPHFPMWGPPNYPWQPMETWHWKQPYTGVHADAWGCPVLPSPSSCPPPPPSTFPQVQRAYGFHNQDHYGKIYADPNPGEEVIDKVVKEAINKPWLPLPIGLNPPSTDSVLSELSKQGISSIPSHINGHNSC